jgi:hypothetical protein
VSVEIYFPSGRACDEQASLVWVAIELRLLVRGNNTREAPHYPPYLVLPGPLWSMGRLEGAIQHQRATSSRIEDGAKIQVDGRLGVVLLLVQYNMFTRLE